jgi:methyltransferase family protein
LRELLVLNLKKYSDCSDPSSFANRMRAKRFELFETLVASIPKPIRIIDVGGTQGFWENRGWAGREDVEVTLVNLTAEPSRHKNILACEGDATNLSGYSDSCFDVAFSNSVIEHLFTLEKQKAMAREVQRVARAFWVQTPNYWFPVEPHFQIPGWQWLPESIRVGILRRHRCGRRGPYPSEEEARQAVCEIRLMTRRELARLFPNADIVAEKFFGFTKSWIVYHGFP